MTPYTSDMLWQYHFPEVVALVVIVVFLGILVDILFVAPRNRTTSNR